MIVNTSEYLISNTDWQKCPAAILPEYAFIGRSNVGKSSLINMITGRYNLARVSGTPGKTRTINHYLINGNWNLADLPGYGYAKVSASERKQWEQMIRLYLCNRPNLMTVFVLVDSRLDPQPSDLEFINRLGSWKIPFVLLFTKSDKVKPGQLVAHVHAFLGKLSASWEVLPQHFITSATERTGKKEILGLIMTANSSFLRDKKHP